MQTDSGYVKPWLLPSGIQRGIEFIIAADWSAEQAEAVIDLLDDLREVISARYELQLLELMREERCQRTPPADDCTDKDAPF